MSTIDNKWGRFITTIKQLVGQILLAFTTGTKVGEWYDLPRGWEGSIKVVNWRGYYLTYNDSQTTFYFPSVSGSVTFYADGSEPITDPRTKLLAFDVTFSNDEVSKRYRLSHINF